MDTVLSFFTLRALTSNNEIDENRHVIIDLLLSFITTKAVALGID